MTGTARYLAAVLAFCSVSAGSIAGGSVEGVIAPADTLTIYIARRGWHIDIGMAAADLSPPLNQAVAYLADAKYVFFGFADRHYLLAANHHAPVLFSALWPGASILLTTGLNNSPAEAFGTTHVITLNVTQNQLRGLQAFIWRSLRTHDDVLDVYRQGPYEGSVYFLATQKYSAFHTCNTWAAEALRAAGFHVHTVGVMFAGQLWTQARRLKRLQSRTLGQKNGTLGPERPCSPAPQPYRRFRLTGTLDRRSPQYCKRCITTGNAASTTGRLGAVLADHSRR